MTRTPALERLLRQTERAERQHFWFRGFRRFVRPLLDRAAAGRRDLALLDCGCGTGANLGLLDAYGTAFGFDLTKAGVELAVSRYGRRRVARASTMALPFGAASFDLVTSFDVLYCLPEGADRQAVAEFYRVLRTGGALVVTVAAMDVLRGAHSVAAAEERRYSRAGLKSLLEAGGFEVVRISYTNAVLFPILLLQRAVERLRGLPPHADHVDNQLGVPPAPVNTLLSAALAVESVALRWLDMPFGSSLAVLARKK